VYLSAKDFPAMVGAENANSFIPRTYPCTKLDLKWNKKKCNLIPSQKSLNTLKPHVKFNMPWKSCIMNIHNSEKNRHYNKYRL
jgi:hypothetical protein